jgi:hypoxanthine phosphoribosyltransferase
MTIEHITLDDVYKFVNKIAEYYEAKDEMPTGVYGLPRGGLILAVMLSHKLAVPLLMAPYDGCLIVDDIADSGESLVHYDRMGYDIATIVLGDNSSVKPILYYKKREADWVKFFWEFDQDCIADSEAYYSAHSEE